MEALGYIICFANSFYLGTISKYLELHGIENKTYESLFSLKMSFHDHL